MPRLRGRKGRMGQVPLAALIVFIALFVICAGLSYVFYQQLSKKQAELSAAVQLQQDAQNRESQANKKYNELLGVFGWQDLNVARGLLPAEAPLSLPYELPAAYSHPDMKDIRELTYFLTDVRQNYLKAWQKAKESFDKESEGRRAAETARQFEIIERENQVKLVRSQLQLEIDLLQKNLDELKKTDDEVKAKLVAEIKAKDDLAAQAASQQKTLAEKQDYINMLEDRLAKRTIFAKAAELEPDGKILNVEPQLGFAYIDLGSKENVQPGWRFTVVRPSPKGYQAIGEAVVRRVEEDVSRVVIKADDPMAPIVAGDFVANAAYDPKKKITLAFAGTFDAFKVEQAKQLALRYGATTADSLSPYVDYLVIGKEPGAALEDARRYGIGIMTQEQFLSYVGRDF